MNSDPDLFAFRLESTYLFYRQMRVSWPRHTAVFTKKSYLNRLSKWTESSRMGLSRSTQVYSTSDYALDGYKIMC